MFQEAELTRLQVQKKMLVLQSRANRLLLAAEWQNLRSAKPWREEAGRVLQEHPILTTTLAAAAGVLAIRSFTQPTAVAGGLGKVGKLASLAFSVWKILQRRDKGGEAERQTKNNQTTDGHG